MYHQLIEKNKWVPKNTKQIWPNSIGTEMTKLKILFLFSKKVDSTFTPPYQNWKRHPDLTENLNEFRPFN